ncbi:MAG: alkaline phosphatase family protein [Acidobacteriota bacterium]
MVRGVSRRCRLGVVLLCWLGLGCAPAVETPPESGRLVVIGVDSLSWELIDPLIEQSELPNLTALRDRGWGATMQTVEPLISPPNWTSIATGRRPDAHGITSFFADRRHVRVPTTWERLAAAGRRVGVYDVLVTWPPRELPDGVVIPGWLRRDASVWPPDLAERWGGEPYTYQVLDMGSLDDTVAQMEEELERKPIDFLHLLDTFDLDVGFVNFYAVDVVNHRFRHTFTPDVFDPPIPVESRFDGVLLDTLRQVDRAIGTIVDGLDGRDHVLVVSDHGATASSPVPRLWGFATPRLLAEAGLDVDGSVRTINGFIEAVFQIADGPADARDATIARFVEGVDTIRTADGEPLFAVDVVREPETVVAVSPPDAPRIDRMAPNLPAHAFVFVSVAHPEVDRLWPDGIVTIGDRSERVGDWIQAHDFTGDHHPLALFLAAGPAVSPNLPRGNVSVVDVASWVLHLAGQPIPADLEGRSPAPWLDPEHLKRFPVRVIPADQAAVLPPEPDAPMIATDDAELEERLRALGYVE